MAAAVWMIIYDLDRTHADRYLQWFDEVHIPEKLARPGYTWAAHYRVVAAGEEGSSRYIALFGGADSRVFYNPSPAQIKPGQSPETRSMMGYRSNSTMLILSEEWAVDSAASASSPQISAERIKLALFNTNENDENLGAWLVQEYLAGSAKSGVTRKFLASTGVARHVLVREMATEEIARDAIVDASASEWSGQVANYLVYPTGSPVVARRVWPGVGENAKW
jgi:hypothetical protein